MDIQYHLMKYSEETDNKKPLDECLKMARLQTSHKNNNVLTYIVALIDREFHHTYNQYACKTRKRELMDCRQILTYFIRKYTDKPTVPTLEQTADIIGINHSTVVHSINAVEQMYTTKLHRSKLNAIIGQLTATGIKLGWNPYENLETRKKSKRRRIVKFRESEQGSETEILNNISKHPNKQISL